MSTEETSLCKLAAETDYAPTPSAAMHSEEPETNRATAAINRERSSPSQGKERQSAAATSAAAPPPVVGNDQLNLKGYELESSEIDTEEFIRRFNEAERVRWRYMYDIERNTTLAGRQRCEHTFKHFDEDGDMDWMRCPKAATTRVTSSEKCFSCGRTNRFELLCDRCRGDSEGVPICDGTQHVSSPRSDEEF